MPGQSALFQRAVRAVKVASLIDPDWIVASVAAID
jgi:hypothetical protein